VGLLRLLTILFKRAGKDAAPVQVGSTGALVQVDTPDESAAGETSTTSPCRSQRLRSASRSRLCLLASRPARASRRWVVVSPDSSVYSAASVSSWRALSRLSEYRIAPKNSVCRYAHGPALQKATASVER
jgi:hypothetical protein